AKGYHREYETFLMSLDNPNIIIPDCDLKRFEKIVSLNSRFLRMSLIEGQLEIIPSLPVRFESTNKSLVGARSSSQGAYRLLKLENLDSLDKPIILSPDAAVVLKARFLDVIKYKDTRNEAFPPVSPNFIIELRSPIDSSQNLHQKMIR
ncbi:10746_t:CDS:2, partial [Dentiscutata heterogama]